MDAKQVIQFYSHMPRQKAFALLNLTAIISHLKRLADWSFLEKALFFNTSFNSNPSFDSCRKTR